MTLRLATRGSPLALWQAEAVAAALRRDDPALEVRLVEVKTEGDRVVDRPIAEVGVQGAFTVEVDQAVRDGRADAAVHSLKDLATTPTPGLALAATLPRGSAEDALLAPRFGAFERLPPEAVVATGSPRRRAQLRRLRPDLRFVDVRGNIATRLARLDSGACDAMVLARAGLERLGLAARISETFSFERVLPAAGQALVGVTCRA
ncbi:MAG TPA: hydroxymethylbilane synthase, partial [Planctomycetota bacterium]|nr:hydroxymethylbilane synthase [Planctomycetota bacterium]